MEKKKVNEILQEYEDLKDFKLITITQEEIYDVQAEEEDQEDLELDQIDWDQEEDNEFNKEEVEKVEKEISYSVREESSELMTCYLKFGIILKRGNLQKFLDDQKLEPNWQAMRDFLSINIDDKKSGWKKVQGSPTRKYATKKQVNDPVFSVKSEFTMFNKNINDLFNLLADCKLQMSWDKHFESVDIVEKLSKYSDIVYLRVKRLFKIVSPRDMVMYRFIANNKDNIEIFDSLGIERSQNNRVKLLAYLRSVDRPNFPPQKGYIRAYVPIILTIMEESEEDPQTIKVVIINNTDIKGRFPKFLFNLFAPDMVGRMKLKLNQAYDKIYGKK